MSDTTEKSTQYTRKDRKGCAYRLHVLIIAMQCAKCCNSFAETDHFGCVTLFRSNSGTSSCLKHESVWQQTKAEKAMLETPHTLLVLFH